jgi:Family of unknown function (DUF6498)
MERLLAWYQVGSSFAAVAALILANLVPLVGVLWFGWDVWGILIIYWLENGIYGLFNVLKMRKAAGPEDGSPMTTAETRRRLNGFTVNGRPPTGFDKAALVPFFIMHYGIFWVVHGIFVLTLPMFAMMGADGAPDFGATVNPLAILFVVVCLFISHGVSYRLNYIGRAEYLRTTAAQQMFAPYGRLVVLHVTIIFGAVLIGMTGAPAAAIVVLVLLKIVLDLGLHLAEHRAAEGPQGGTATEGGAAR